MDGDYGQKEIIRRLFMLLTPAELKATNGQDATGTSQLSFFVNEPPTSGSCSLMMNGTVERFDVIQIIILLKLILFIDNNNNIYRDIIGIYRDYFSSFTSLIDSVEFTCKDWADPEKIGISAYVLYSTDLGTNVKKK